MSNNRFHRTLATGLMVAVIILTGAVAAQEKKIDVGPSSQATVAPMQPSIDPATSSSDAVINMFQGETRVLSGLRPARIAVGAQKVLTASALDDTDVLLIANETGSSTLMVWNRQGRLTRFNVQVSLPASALINREIQDFVTSIPGVNARVIGTRILVEGHDLGDDALARIDLLARAYPQIINFTEHMGWERMIQLDVKVVEFKKNKSLQLGIQWSPNAYGPMFGVVGDVLHNGTFKLIAPPQTNAPTGTENLPAYTTPFKTYLGLTTALTSQINMAESRGDAAILATPKLTVRSGGHAKFTSGGEIPYSAIAPNGVASIDFKEYGVRLDVRPFADGHGGIRALVEAEVSNVDTSIQTGGGPALTKRSASTEFNVHTGETMVIAGLRNQTTVKSVNKVPGLGSIPIIGRLFRSDDDNAQDTELVIFMTANIVDAQTEAADQRQKDEVVRETAGVVSPARDAPAVRDWDPGF